MKIHRHKYVIIQSDEEGFANHTLHRTHLLQACRKCTQKRIVTIPGHFAAYLGGPNERIERRSK